MRSSNCCTLKSFRRSGVEHSGQAAEGLVNSVSTHPSHLNKVEFKVMHMPLACPRDQPPGLPGGIQHYVGEKKRMEWVLCPWVGGIQEIVSESMNLQLC